MKTRNIPLPKGPPRHWGQILHASSDTHSHPTRSSPRQRVDSPAAADEGVRTSRRQTDPLGTPIFTHSQSFQCFFHLTQTGALRRSADA